ncbi:MAG TPA: hypothetical protein VMJ10_08400, partial [Kofleriaceae bacterium]|nr:hypothetical protein [Kofleriaceae bacterium]
AVVTKLDHGPLQDLGLAEHYIVLAIGLALALAVGAIWYVKATKKADPGPLGIGPVAAASADARPEWVRTELTPGSASCVGAAGKITCSGASSLLASQEEAEDEASDAALEALAAEAGRSIRDTAWNTAIQAQIVPARDAALAAYSRDPQSTQARRAVHDGRRAVSHALARGNGPQIGARYWEAFDEADGRRYVAFASVTVPVAQLQGAAAGYAQPSAALGATVVSFFPELGWRFPRLEHGAVVTKLDHGPLQDLGLAEHYIVLAIDGRDVVDAPAFAKIADEEYAQLALHGGLLRLLVQTDTGDPREFSRPIAGKADPELVPHSHDTHPQDVPPTGGINVWDRFGGNRGGGRDDPAQ